MRKSLYLISIFIISGALVGCLNSNLDEDGDGVRITQIWTMMEMHGKTPRKYPA